MAELYIPNAANWINAFEAGQDARMVRQKRDAAAAIGGAMASGDYKRAAELAYGAGEFGTGLKLQERQEAAQDKARRTEVLKQATTDPEGAATAALEIDPDFYTELKGIADKAKLEKAKKFGGILRSIGNEPEDAWDDLIAANRGSIEALDIPPQEIDAFIQAQPEQRRVMMRTMLARADMLDAYLGDLDKAADNKRADAQFEETKRGNRVSEQQRGAQIGIAQGNLAQRRAEHAERKKQGGYGSNPLAGISDDELLAAIGGN